MAVLEHENKTSEFKTLKLQVENAQSEEDMQVLDILHFSG